MENKSFGGGGHGCGSNKAIDSSSGAKSYERSATAKAASNVASVGGANSLTIIPKSKSVPPEESHQNPELAIGPPWLKGYILFDGLSHEVNELFEPLIYNIGEASGRFIHFVDIGDPEQSDPIYKKMRTAKLKEHDFSTSKSYKKKIRKIGQERLYRLSEHWELVKWLGIEKHNLPCIAFTTNPPWYPMEFLKLKSAYYSLSEGRRAFGLILINWLSKIKREKFELPDITNKDLLAKFKKELENLSEIVDKKVGAAINPHRPRSYANNFCQVITHDASMDVSLPGYEELLSCKSDYDLFIDGFSQNSWNEENNELSDGVCIPSKPTVPFWHLN